MTKEDLEEYQDLKKEAKIVYGIWRKLEKEKISFNSIGDGMPKPSNKRTLGDVIAESDARSQEYYSLHLRALQALTRIERFIGTLSEPLHRNILRLKYIERWQWWRVARELNYSERQIFNIISDILGENFEAS